MTSFPVFERARGNYRITTGRDALNVDAIESFLRKSYWAANRSRERIERSLEHSLCFAVLHDDRQVGFARVVSDYTDFAWLCDVYIDESHRGNGLGVFVVETVLEHPELRGLRRWILATRDAHELYAKFGFQRLNVPERWMERYDESP
jgi:GNAT superfamily N-acetyltransferase